mmetsp:Transcript_10440/g.26302  ORF Transcript_10440/g.26302 Transcript_10440/m.26302 type:complete len:205 (-) Transcript_10440:707-1321(-)
MDVEGGTGGGEDVSAIRSSWLETPSSLCEGEKGGVSLVSFLLGWLLCSPFVSSEATLFGSECKRCLFCFGSLSLSPILGVLLWSVDTSEVKCDDTAAGADAGFIKGDVVAVVVVMAGFEESPMPLVICCSKGVANKEAAAALGTAIFVDSSLLLPSASCCSSPPAPFGLCPLGIMLNKNPSLRSKNIRRSCSSRVRDLPTNPFI